MNDCIFCRIASGGAGVDFVFENEAVVAFDDLSPQAPVHSLIVPREHFASLEDEIPPSVLGALLAAVPHVASAKGVSEGGYRVIINTGADAGQTVHHLHVHVLAGRKMPEGMIPRSKG